ncbi:hypothetical protein OCAE111667_24590 [Occultella aeris]|uniref:Uncharacterized protein n=1 Tax=Occultella aeris TaxID=2761496 RepID=A0A7M4DKU0_9MICO|nr:hypothetical protein [Occultella aeris]VZO37813.1 hypothetical protein HALOF300_02755 [Occultella aeris]
MATISPAPAAVRVAAPARSRVAGPARAVRTEPAVRAGTTDRAEPGLGTHAPPSTAFGADATQPRPVRDSLLPATLSLLAVLGVLTGLAAAAGWVVRAVAEYFLG